MVSYDIGKLVNGKGPFKGANPGNNAPSPLNLITSVAVTNWWRADLGITLNSGKVSAWANQVNGGAHFSQATSSAQPTYNASDATFNNLPTLTTDGVDDYLQVPVINLTGSIFIITVCKMISANVSAAIYSNPLGYTGDGNYLQTFGIMYQSGPSANANSGSFALVQNNWSRFRDRRQNNAGDYIRLGASTYSGTPCPLSVNPAGSWSIGGVSLGLSQNVVFREIIICNGEPTPTELTNIDAYITAQNAGTLI